MTDVALVAPRGDAVAAEVGNTMVRTDGRNRRAAETRRKIIAAAKAMITETSVAPTVVGVAKRADVSVRSVFQHFHDVESLFVTVMDSIRADLAVPELPSASRPLAARIEDIVKVFAELFDKVVPLRVAAGQFVDHPALIERSQQARNELHPSSRRSPSRRASNWPMRSARRSRSTPGSCCVVATVSASSARSRYGASR